MNVLNVFCLALLAWGAEESVGHGSAGSAPDETGGNVEVRGRCVALKSTVPSLLGQGSCLSDIAYMVCRILCRFMAKESHR